MKLNVWEDLNTWIKTSPNSPLLCVWKPLNTWIEQLPGLGIYWGVNTGWANSCGDELFTLGWIQCDQEPTGVFNRTRMVNFGKIKPFLKHPRFKV